METRTIQSRHDLLELKFDSYPDICPHCHQGISANYISGFVNEDLLYLHFTCPIKYCQNYFIFEYKKFYTAEYKLYRPILRSPYINHFPPLINQISPEFVQIYDQAIIAQEENLDLICGMGFRKALEFLIKDYIGIIKPEIKEKVKAKLLAQCINDHIENTKIKELASRATWLGNDETHYVRKWDTLSVEHLKKLISLTIYWISAEHESDSLISLMQKKII